MTAANPIVLYWYFHLPNFVLAALMYTCMGRLVLSFLLPPDSRNFIWRAFRRVTEPAVRAVGWITPAIVPLPVVVIFTTLWLLILRMGLFVTLFGLGLAPTAA